MSMLVSELVVHPLLQHRVPSILKCIGIASFLVLLSNIAFLTVSVIDMLYSLDLSYWLLSLYNIIFGFFIQFIASKTL